MSILELSEGISGCVNLTDLNLQYCYSLIGTLELFVSIRDDTTLFLDLPDSLGECKSLTSLDLRRCGALQSKWNHATSHG